MPEDTPATIPVGGGDHVIDLAAWLTDDGDAPWAGQTVTIRPFLSYAADRRIESARLKMQAEIEGEGGNRRSRRDRDVSMTTEITPMDYAAAVVEECVIEWTLIGHDGKRLGCNRFGLESQHAPAELLDTVIEEIMDFYEARRPKLSKS